MRARVDQKERGKELKFEFGEDLIQLKNHLVVKGQLQPIFKDGFGKGNEQICLITDNGREFSLSGSDQWKISLWRHVWDYVILEGRVNYFDQSIVVSSFQPEEVESIEQWEHFSEPDYDSDVFKIVDLIKRQLLDLQAI